MCPCHCLSVRLVLVFLPLSVCLSHFLALCLCGGQTASKLVVRPSFLGGVTDWILAAGRQTRAGRRTADWVVLAVAWLACVWPFDGGLSERLCHDALLGRCRCPLGIAANAAAIPVVTACLLPPPVRRPSQLRIKIAFCKRRRWRRERCVHGGGSGCSGCVAGVQPRVSTDTDYRHCYRSASQPCCHAAATWTKALQQKCRRRASILPVGGIQN